MTRFTPGEPRFGPLAGDPLADPRAADLLAAQPDELIAAAARLRATAGESGQVGSGLSAAQHDGTWSGRAADAFRSAIGRLIPTLGRVDGTFAAVAATLSAYEAELASIRPQFLRLAGEIDAGGSTRSAAELAVLRQRAFALLDDFAAARDACRMAIADQRSAVAPLSGGVLG